MLTALVAIVPLLTAAPGSTLTAVAASSSRPKECVVSERTGKPTFWRRARFPQQGAYCDAVAKSHIELLEDPKRALETAERAATLWPGKPGALVAKARALVELGQFDEAIGIFSAVNEALPNTFDEPRALWSFARALARTGSLALAEPMMRKLVPRVSFFSQAERTEVLIEAAFVLTAIDEAAPEEPTRIDDARAFIEEARKLSDGSADAAFASAWLAVRAGDAASSDATIKELQANRVEVASKPAYLLTEADRKGFVALLLEARSEVAFDAWSDAATATKRKISADSCASRAKPPPAVRGR